jgi:hypothetical protein
VGGTDQASDAAVVKKLYWSLIIGHFSFFIFLHCQTESVMSPFTRSAFESCGSASRKVAPLNDKWVRCDDN